MMSSRHALIRSAVPLTLSALMAVTGHRALAQSAVPQAASPMETALGLTRELSPDYLEACTEILRSTRANPCPPLIPADTEVAHSWGDSIDAMAASVTSIDGRDIDAHGGHWTLGVGTGPAARKAMAADLHVASSGKASQCRLLRLEKQRVEACAMPPYPVGGYYGGHIAYAWEHDSVTYHITVHGHANEPRARLMMAALIEQMLTPEVKRRFRTVTIRRCADGEPTGPTRDDRDSVSPGKVALRCRTLEWLATTAFVQYANGLSHSRFAVGPGGTRVAGGPAWMASEAYTIDATADGDAGRAMMLGPMLQAFLEERFALKVRYEYRTQKVYELRLADGWHNKLERFEKERCVPTDYAPVDVDASLLAGRRWCSAGLSVGSLSRLDMEGTTLLELARFLSNQSLVGTRVSDRTGLSGRYDLTVEFAAAAATDSRARAKVRASLIAAMERRLGLTLQPARVKAEFLVVERAQRPAISPLNR